jgi:hypothetical protein
MLDAFFAPALAAGQEAMEDRVPTSDSPLVSHCFANGASSTWRTTLRKAWPTHTDKRTKAAI